MDEGIEVANKGGTFGGEVFEGAVNFTNDRMLDYTSYNKIFFAAHAKWVQINKT